MHRGLSWLPAIEMSVLSPSKHQIYVTGITNVEFLAVVTVLVGVDAEFVVEIAVVCDGLRESYLWNRSAVLGVDWWFDIRSVERAAATS